MHHYTPSRIVSLVHYRLQRGRKKLAICISCALVGSFYIMDALM